MSWRAVAIAGALIVPSGAVAAGPLDALQACRAIAGDAERLRCFDRAAAELDAATKREDVVVVERKDIQRTRRGLFGFALPPVALLTGRPGNAQDEEESKRLETTVTTARALPYGKWRFTIEGGATWETVEASSGFVDPRPGAAVVLEKGSLGAYYAKVGKGRRVQAKRIG